MDGPSTLDVVVLNYNGRALLARCLPTIDQAIRRSRHSWRLSVIDNDSTDGSSDWLRVNFPQARIFSRPNRGLCSFNDVLPCLTGPVAILLNNDVCLAPDCLDPWVQPLLDGIGNPGSRVHATAPACRRAADHAYEGFRTAVRWRWGLVQATFDFPGHRELIHRPGVTALAGAALAVDRQAFLAIGGFDPLYLPGRIEDLDYFYRAHKEGWQAAYVPTAVVYHAGQASFGTVFGDRGCRHLAIRNTLLFQWKHLRTPGSLLHQAIGLSARLARDLALAPFVTSSHRLAFCRALLSAFACAWSGGPLVQTTTRSLASERQWFRDYAPGQHVRDALTSLASADANAARANEISRVAADFPCSRWYALPAAARLATALSATSVQPWHVTIVGLILALVGIWILVSGASPAWVAAVFALGAWMCDRIDGPLARLRRAASAGGAWLDANVDELVDLGFQAAIAVAATRDGLASASAWLAAVVAGKYLFMYGLASEESLANAPATKASIACASRLGLGGRALRWLYHLPANADVRLHFLVVCLATQCYAWQLIALALYYNFRWMVRYGLVLRRASMPREAVA